MLNLLKNYNASLIKLIMDPLERAILRFVLVPIFFLIMVFIAHERINKKKMEQHKKSINFSKDIRPLILYLRSFQTDGLKKYWSYPMPLGYSSPSFPLDSFEMKLGRDVEKLGKFYAVGNPTNEEKEIGAVREFFLDEDWKSAVLNKMNEARIIIFRPSPSEGTIWEFKQLLNYGYLTKTIITVMDEEFLEYEKFRLAVKDILPTLPNNVSEEMFICIDQDLNISFYNKVTQTPLFLNF